MTTHIPRALFALTAIALATSTARAVDISLPGTRLVIKTARSGKLVYTYKGRIATVPGPDADPKTYGAAVRILNPDSGETTIFALPASNWSGPDTAVPRRYVRRYRDRRGSVGPVKLVVFRPARGLKMVARATGITVDEPTQGTVGVVLSMNGSLNYCSVFGGTVVKDHPGAFVAKGAAAPTSCPTGVCGNGNVDAGEECDDAVATSCPANQTCASCRCVGAGDVSVQLVWDSVEDVDLHVIDPNGEEIYWDHRTSASGGTLDVDANHGCTGDTHPVENVVWPAGTAPHGEYVVLVVHYRQCTSSETPIAYRVRVMHDGVTSEYPGTLPNIPFCPATCGECGQCAEVVRFTR
jgi:hypothetical protein